MPRRCILYTHLKFWRDISVYFRYTSTITLIDLERNYSEINYLIYVPSFAWQLQSTMTSWKLNFSVCCKRAQRCGPFSQQNSEIVLFWKLGKKQIQFKYTERVTSISAPFWSSNSLSIWHTAIHSSTYKIFNHCFPLPSVLRILKYVPLIFQPFGFN
jgi:hypothetical protein